MKYLIWGTGAYCKDKIEYNFQNPDDEIIGFVDRKRGKFLNREVILPSDIPLYQYDKIVIFSKTFLEITKELIEIGIKADRIIPGISLLPYRGEEIQWMTDDSIINVREDGSLIYSYGEKEIIISGEEDWVKVKKLFCSEENNDLVKKININPVSRLFGIDRGMAIDRYYIERFLKENSQYIQGNVLEMGENTYTKKYGVKNCDSYVFIFDKEKGVVDQFVYGNLENGENLPNGLFDCIIFTQVFNFIFDVSTAITNSIKMLKSGGVLLLTVAGNTPISKYDMQRWGHYWNFTYKAIERLCCRANTECIVVSYGNCKSACEFLQGMAVDDVEDIRELDYYDANYPIVIGACVKKI